MMAEEFKDNNNLPLDTQASANIISNNGSEKTQTNVQKKESKKSKKKKTEYKEFYIPEKVKSFRFRIIADAIEIIRKEPFIQEKDLVLKILAKDQVVKEYYARVGELGYIRFIIWNAVKEGLIIPIKLVGDKRHTYFLLPEQYDQYKQFEYRATKEE